MVKLLIIKSNRQESRRAYSERPRQQFMHCRIEYFIKCCCSSCSLFHYYNFSLVLVSTFCQHGIPANVQNPMPLKMMRTLHTESETWCLTTTLLINIRFNWSTCRMEFYKSTIFSQTQVDVLIDGFAPNIAAGYSNHECL